MIPNTAGDGAPARSDSTRITRRSLLDQLLKGSLAASALAMATPAFAYLWPVTRKGSTSARVEVGKLSDFPVGAVRRVGVDSQPVNVVRTSLGVVAYSAICTHLGCVVDWDAAGKRFACPCHAGFYDMRGKVISGPPPQALRQYEVQVIDDVIYVKA